MSCCQYMQQNPRSKSYARIGPVLLPAWSWFAAMKMFHGKEVCAHRSIWMTRNSQGASIQPILPDLPSTFFLSPYSTHTLLLTKQNCWPCRHACLSAWHHFSSACAMPVVEDIVDSEATEDLEEDITPTSTCTSAVVTSGGLPASES